MVNIAKIALVPCVDMSPERDGRLPVCQFVQDIVQFLTAIGRSKLVERRAEDIGVGEGKDVTDFFLVALEDTVLNFVNLIIAKCAIGRVQEDESVIDSVIIVDYSNGELIKRCFENSAKQSPAIVGDVMVANNRIERQARWEDIIFVFMIDVTGSRVCEKCRIYKNLPIFLVNGNKVFIHPFFCFFLYNHLGIIVILGLGVSKVAQVAIEEVVVLHADFDHFFKSAWVFGDVAVAAHEERILLDSVGKIFVPSYFKGRKVDQ